MTDSSTDRSSQPTRASVVSLRPVTVDNLDTVLNLTVNEAQKSFVSPNAVSIAQAHFHPETAWFRAIYADETVVGFVMISDNAQIPEYYLWRLMIDATYQGLGFGRRTVEKVIDYVRTRPGATHLLVCCVPGAGGPCPFYDKLGFVDTGEVLYGQHVYRLDLVADSEETAAPPLSKLPPQAAQ